MYILSIFFLFVYYAYICKKNKRIVNPFDRYNPKYKPLSKRFISSVKKQINQVQVNNTSRTTKPKSKFYKHEERCREIFQKIFGQPFKSVRPAWLKNPSTGHNLEIDGFCSSVKTPIGTGLGFEMDGRQHSEYTPFFHRHGVSEFKYQISKDRFKTLKCKEKKVMLIRIPHYVAYEDLERFIENKCRKMGLI